MHQCIFSISQKPLGFWLRFTAVLIYSMYLALLASTLAFRDEFAAARSAVTWADLAGANLHQPGNVRLPWAAFVHRFLQGNACWLEHVPFRAFWNMTRFCDVARVSVSTRLPHFSLISMSQVNVNNLVLMFTLSGAPCWEHFSFPKDSGFFHSLLLTSSMRFLSELLESGNADARTHQICLLFSRQDCRRKPWELWTKKRT